MAIELLTSTGAGTWTVPRWVTSVDVQLVGGGGGGGDDSSGGGGGGGGTTWGSGGSQRWAGGGGGGSTGGNGGGTDGGGTGGTGGGGDGGRRGAANGSAGSGSGGGGGGGLTESYGSGGAGGPNGGGNGGFGNGGAGTGGGGNNSHGATGQSGSGVSRNTTGGDSGAFDVSALSGYGDGGGGTWDGGGVAGSGGGGGGYTSFRATVSPGARIPYFVGGGGKNPSANDGENGVVRLAYVDNTLTVGISFPANDAKPTAGDTVRFSRSVGGTAIGAITQQWQTSATGTGGWVNVGTGTTYDHRRTSPGTVYVRCRVTREGLTATSSVLDLTWDGSRPTWNDDTGDAISGTVGRTIADVVVPTVDSAKPTPTYTAVGNLPAGVSFNRGTLTLSFDEDAIGAGSGTIRIRATNPVGSDDWTVSYTFVNPTITVSASVSDANPTSGDTVRFSRSVGGTAIGAITQQWQTSANGTSGWTNVGTGTTYSHRRTSPGTIYVRCRVTREGVSRTSSVVSATWGGIRPTWNDDTGDAISGTVGRAIADVVVPTVDAGNPAPTYAAVGELPAGITFTPGTRTLSFDEDTIEAGSGTITIRATNTVGSDDWTVDYNFRAPVRYGTDFVSGFNYGSAAVSAVYYGAHRIF